MIERHSGAWLLAPDVAPHVFVSAHFDDAVFSCGGSIATLAQAGRHPTLAVVFAAAPEAGASLTPFAADHNALWGIAGDATASNAGRQREELAAASLL
nr:PIG-L family deacetylase [Chloroflexia bacterium]